MVPLTLQQYTPALVGEAMMLNEGVVSIIVVPSLVHCILLPSGSGCDEQLNVTEEPLSTSKLRGRGEPTNTKHCTAQ